MKGRGLVLGVVILVAAIGTGTIAAIFIQQPDRPFSSKVITQPIAFPHDLHAGANQIPCMYCHYSADRSPDAGMPSLQTCAGCHINTLAGNLLLFRQESPELVKLLTYWKAQQPIPWARIYKIPDHAHFPHMRHINAGVVCQTCHGAVETMREVVQYPSLQMGWCVQCHRQNQVRTDCMVCHY
jgi:cytochrome c553